MAEDDAAEAEAEAEALWRGGDAVVYEAGTGLAAKRCFTEEAFLAELDALASLRHPNVLRLLGFDVDARVLWTPLYDGDVMKAALAREAVDVLGLGRDLFAAVAHCHRAGIVHGDVKPENVLLRPGRGAALCDFARAVRLPEGAAAVRLEFRGTEAYGAPEALRGWCGHAADAWGSACVLYVAAELELPFDDDDGHHLEPPTLKQPCWPCEAAAAVAARLFEPEPELRCTVAEAAEEWG